MFKTAVIGDKGSVSGFAAAGLAAYVAEEPSAAIRMIREVAQNGYGVVFITESLAGAIEPELERFRSLLLPAIIPIPDISGDGGLGMAQVSKFVEQAVGSDILSEE